MATWEPPLGPSTAVPSEVPPLVHGAGLDNGPQTENATLPVGGMPAPVTVAVSSTVPPSWRVVSEAVAPVIDGPRTMKHPSEPVSADGL